MERSNRRTARRKAAFAFLPVLLVAALSGCAAPPGIAAAPSPQTARRTTTSDVTACPRVAETTAQAPPGVQFKLPGSCRLTDHTDTLAAFTRIDRTGAPVTTLGLLDLRSGRSAVALPRAVNAAKRWDLFRPALSERWIAWEEVSPGEGGPSGSDWQLLAAPVDRAALTVGRPRLVAAASTVSRLRPHYALVGDTLYWTDNAASTATAGPAGDACRVRALDLATGAGTIPVVSSHRFTVMRSSCGTLAVVEEGTAPAGPVRLRVLNGATGRETSSSMLPVTAEALSHAPVVSALGVCWAAFSAPGAQWPDLFLRDTHGATLLAGVDAVDPVAADGLLLFESVVDSVSVGGRRTSHGIDAVDLEHSRRFPILSTTTDNGGWWQTVTGGDARHTILIANDLGMWNEDAAHAWTIVCRYDAERR
jgi:hypothetical protein